MPLLLPPQSLALGNSVFVDPINGSDATAARQRFDRRFKSIGAAVAAASAGDCVHVFPGTYNERGLLKNGVNFHFHPGTVVKPTGNVAGHGIFDDFSAIYVASGSSHAIGGAPMVSKIVAHGARIIFDAKESIAGNGCAVVLTNPGSDLEIHGGDWSHTGAYTSGAGLSGEDCVFRHAKGSLKYDVNSVSAGNDYPALNWWTDGPFNAKAQYMFGGNVLYATPGDGANNSTIITSDYNATTAFHCHLDCPQIRLPYDNCTAFQVLGSDVARYWVKTSDVLSDDTSGAPIILHGGGLFYLNAQKLGYTQSRSGASNFFLASLIGAASSEFYCNVQKIVNSGGSAFYINGSSGCVNTLEIQRCEDKYNSTYSLILTDTGNAARTKIKGGEWLTGTTCDALQQTGAGPTIVGGAWLDSSAASSNNPVNAQANGVTLLTTALNANGSRKKITGASGKTVTTDGLCSLITAGNPYETVMLSNLDAT